MSDRYRLDSLKVNCQTFMLQGLEPDNAAYFYSLGDYFQGYLLKEAALRMILANFSKMKYTSTWNQLSEKQLQDILACIQYELL
jgi:hypothetical protein